jgi:dynein heavy chain
VRFPSKGTIFDYYVDQSGETSKFSEWAKRIVQIDFDPSAGMTMGNITVPTIETIATSDFIKNFLSSKFPSLMIGNAGCGKT